MSAFIVSDQHIHAIVSFAVMCQARTNSTAFYATRRHTDLREPADRTKLGQLLLKENYKSVGHRYREADDFSGDYRHEQVATPTPVEILKLLSCLEYQSCEHPDYRESEAYAVLEHLRGEAIAQLPGYDEAKWAI
jgi:hypothetical protein